MTKPGHADAIAEGQLFHAGSHLVDDADDFMTGNERQLGVSKVALHDMQIRTADGAGAHPDADFSRAQRGFRHVPQGEGLIGLFEKHGAHKAAPSR